MEAIKGTVEVTSHVMLMVQKKEKVKLVKSLESWQLTACYTAQNAKIEEEIREAVEHMGIAQGIMNSLNALELFDKEESEVAVKRQQDIAEEIEKAIERVYGE